MRSPFLSRGCALLAAAAVATPLFADVKTPAIFSDHMVLQQDLPVPVWGWASPGEAVTVSIGEKRQSTQAGADGTWRIQLSGLKASATPTELIIAGNNILTIKDVLIGEVWLGSGQSNMEHTVSRRVKSFAGVVNEEQEVTAANHPQVRMFTVPLKTSETPLDDCGGTWKVCSPETVPAFSAIGYFFSRDLHKALNRPVGFINTSYGASTAQAWVNPEVLKADARFQPLLANYAKALADYDARAATQPAGARVPGRNPHQDQHNPSQCYLGMIVPIKPFAVRGVLWYQGESITGSLEEFANLNDALITSWRKEWNQPGLPFYFVQLASQDANSNRPEVGEAQALALKLPNTAMAVTIDAGERRNVHPRNKQIVGDRLARIARANVYGEKIAFSGPVYQSSKVEGNALRVTFSHAERGLVAKGGDLKWFTIGGADGKFVDATAKIDGNTVIVSSPEVPNPIHVRYAWHRWPEGANLFNGDGLPAAAFRTDSPNR